MRAIVGACWLAGGAIGLGGCHSLPPLDVKPLDDAGMNYDAAKQIEKDKVTQAEILEIAKAKQAGLSDDDCVRLVGIYHARNASFDAGETVAGLLQAGFSEPGVMELAQLNQLGIGVGELEAMKLTGLSEETVLDVARAHAEGRPVLSGASLGRMKNAEMRGSTLLELVKHGVPDSQADAIISAKKHGMSDAEILKHFAS